jgi:ABC-type sugar transport system ATPase subunit
MYMTPTLAEQDDSVVSGKVYVFEQLGERGVLTVELDGQLHRIVTSPDFAGRIGDPVWMSFDTSRMHVFDPQTELNLLAE